MGVSINLDLGISEPYYQGYYNDYLADTWEYVQCTTTPSDPYSDITRADFFGISNYDWCPGNGTLGASNGTFLQQYNVSGWEDLKYNYTDTSIPIFFSDYGCINDVKPQDRDFLEVSALYDNRYMAQVFSGGLVTEWANVQSSEPGADYGLVLLDADGNLRLRKDYDTYSQALGQFDIPLLEAGDEIDSINSLNTPPTCTRTLISDPSSLSFASAFVIPTAPPGVADLIQFGNNGTRGQLVDVTSTVVSQTVRDSSGNILRNLAITPSPSSPRTTTGAPTSNSGSSSGSAPTSSSTTPPNKSNNAVKIGAGVGVSLGVVCLAGLGFLLFWCLRRRQKNNRRSNSATGNHDGIAVSSGSGEMSRSKVDTVPNAYYHPVAPEEEHEHEHELHEPTELESPEIGVGMPEMDSDTGYHGHGASSEMRKFQR